MPTQSLIIDIKVKTNIDTIQNWVSCWVQILAFYFISYCWLQIDDKGLNTNWYIYVGASWSQILVSVLVFHKKIISPKLENPKTAY
jgi:hypothetical protein